MCSSNTNAVSIAELQRGGLTPTQKTHGSHHAGAGAAWVHPHHSLTCGCFWDPAITAMVGGLASSVIQGLFVARVGPCLRAETQHSMCLWVTESCAVCPMVPFTVVEEEKSMAEMQDGV